MSRTRQWRKALPWLFISALLFAPASSAAAGPRVVVTIKPIHSLVAQVMEGIGEPVLLIEGVQSPHVYALKPSDARALHGAGVLFRVAPAIEPFTTKIIQSLPERVTVVTLSKAPGVERLALRKAGAFAAHTHDLITVEGADGTDGRNAEAVIATEATTSEHGEEMDSHVWLDPRNARHMLDSIRDVLAAAVPEHASRFEINAAKAAARLARLEAELTAKLQSVQKRPFVVFHDAFQYFERRFGLNAVASIAANPEAPPSAKQISEIRRRIRESGAKCVFAEPQFDARRVRTVIEGTGAKAGTLDPIGAAIAPGPDAYDALLRKLAADVRDCLAN